MATEIATSTRSGQISPGYSGGVSGTNGRAIRAAEQQLLKAQEQQRAAERETRAAQVEKQAAEQNLRSAQSEERQAERKVDQARIEQQKADRARVGESRSGSIIDLRV